MISQKFNKKDFAFNGWDLDDVLEEFEHVLDEGTTRSSQPIIHKLHLDLNTIDVGLDRRDKKKRRRKDKEDLFE